jgi:hypothetical protein
VARVLAQTGSPIGVQHATGPGLATEPPPGPRRAPASVRAMRESGLVDLFEGSSSPPSGGHQHELPETLGPTQPEA